MADLVPWPELPASVLESLRAWYRTPLQLQAAFDDAAEAYDLLEACRLGLDAASLVTCTDALVAWQNANVQRFKRARISNSMAMRETLVLPQQARPSLQAVYESCVKLSPAAVLALHEKQKAARCGDPVTRNSKEEAERQRYALLLGSCEEEAGLPVCQIYIPQCIP